MRRRLLLVALGALAPLTFFLPAAKAAPAPSACVHVRLVINTTVVDVQLPPGCVH